MKYRPRTRSYAGQYHTDASRYCPFSRSYSVSISYVHCAVEDFNVTICASRRKVGTTQHPAVCMTSCASVQCPGTTTACALQRRSILNWVCLCASKITRTAGYGIPQTGVTIACTINPFGPPSWARLHRFMYMYSLSEVRGKVF